jgi:hypothetical protein
MPVSTVIAATTTTRITGSGVCHSVADGAPMELDEVAAVDDAARSMAQLLDAPTEGGDSLGWGGDHGGEQDLLGGEEPMMRLLQLDGDVGIGIARHTGQQLSGMGDLRGMGGVYDDGSGGELPPQQSPPPSPQQRQQQQQRGQRPARGASSQGRPGSRRSSSRHSSRHVPLAGASPPSSAGSAGIYPPLVADEQRQVML